MTEQFSGKVEILNDDSRVTITLNGTSGGILLRLPGSGVSLPGQEYETIHLEGDSANIILGGAGQDGDITVRNKDRQETIQIEGQSGHIILRPPRGAMSLPGPETIHLEGDSANIILGGAGQDGDITERETIQLDGESGHIRLRFPSGGYAPQGQPRGMIHLEGDNGKIKLGCEEKTTIRLNGDSGQMILGGGGQDGNMIVRTSTGDDAIRLDGDSGDIDLGSPDQGGNMVVRNKDANETIQIEGQSGHIRLMYPEGPVVADQLRGIIQLEGDSGKVKLGAGRGSAGRAFTILLNGDSGQITLGGGGQDGDLIVETSTGEDAIHLNGEARCIRLGHGDDGIRLDGATGDLKLGLVPLPEVAVGKIHLSGPSGDICLGGYGVNGAITIRNPTGEEIIKLDASPPHDGIRIQPNIILGGKGVDALVSVRNKSGQETICLDGDAGDIILQNADCAEDFDVAESAEIEPGTVVVLDGEGKLWQSTEAYDKKVAGVASGAGDCKPALVLDKKPERNGRIPVALMGKVFCKVDAQFAPIEVGDLLTTSPTPGHAMKADDPFKAFGAVIGKALRPLGAGTGLVPIIVALQ